MRPRNRYLEAFKESHNAVGLAVAVALSAATLTPIPLLVGLVLEAAYLLVVPDSKWYAARLAQKFDADIEDRRRQMKAKVLPALRPELRERFARLEALRKQIGARPADEERWFREILRKLDYLMDKFLQFASKEAEFRAHLESLYNNVRAMHPPARPLPSGRGFGFGGAQKRRGQGGEFAPYRAASEFDLTTTEGLPVAAMVTEVQAAYDREREAIRASLETEADLDTQAVQQKRLDVLQRRHEFAGKIGKILANLDHQLQLVEDTFGLINDEIRARSPEQLLSDIEEVVVASNTMTTSLEELAAFDHLMGSNSQ